MTRGATWPVEPLGKLCDISIGRTPARANPAFWGPGRKWVSISDMNEARQIVETKETITETAIRECRCRPVAAGTLLMSFKLSIGKLAFAGEELFTNEAIAALPIRDETKLDAVFLYHSLHVADLLRETDRAVMGKTLNKAKLQKIPIPVPPLDEQRRIAAILDKADAVRRKRQEAIRLTDELLRSAFLEMFGDPVTNPKGWEVLELKHFGKIITGNTPPRSDKSNFGDAIEWIKSDNINTPAHFLTQATEYLSRKRQQRARLAPPGSVLVTCIAGSRSSIGRAAIADREVAFNQQINAVIPNEDVDPHFLYGHFYTAQGLVQAKSTDSMKGLVSKGKFSTIRFLKPPYDLQKRFGYWFRRYLSVCKRGEEGAEAARELFQSLVQRAFRGGL